MKKKMLSLQGLAAVLLLTSVSAWSASPMLDDKDLAETSDYGVMVGGFLEGSKIKEFKAPSANTMPNFEKICRHSAVASVGFSAFGRVCLALNVGSTQAEGTLNFVNGPMKSEMFFEAKPALIWGGKLGVHFYSENCVKAAGFVSYRQSSMNLRSLKGLVTKRKLLFSSSLDTANVNKGYLVIPEDKKESDFNGIATNGDAILSSMPFIIFDPQGTFEDCQYELELRFAYGQQNMAYVGAKVIGGKQTLTCELTGVTNPLDQVMSSSLLDVLLGTNKVTKVEGTRSSYICPVVGICITDKTTQFDVSTTLLAQQDITVQASVSF